MKGKTRLLDFLCLILIGLSLSVEQGWAQESSGGESKNSRFEAISEVDLSFLLTHPKMPWGEDPFQKKTGYAVVPSSGEETFSLTGVIQDGASSVAIINGATVRVGDQVGSRRVSAIGSNFAVLKKKNSEIEVTIPPAMGLDEEVEEETDEEHDDE